MRKRVLSKREKYCTTASFYHAQTCENVSFIQIKTQNQLMDWMQCNHNYVAPAPEEQTIQKIANGKDFLSPRVMDPLRMAATLRSMVQV